MGKLLLCLALCLQSTPDQAKSSAPIAIPPGAKIYIADLGGMESNFLAALNKESVPIVLVGKAESADFVIDGHYNLTAESPRSVFSGRTPMAYGEFTVTQAGTKAYVMARAVHKRSAHGLDDVADALAKDLKDYVLKGK